MQALKQYFGYDAFRPGQQDVVCALLDGRDALCVMPTGAGKSVCYQIPALLFPGVTIVISPLISLMTDQVRALKQAGVPAAYLNSTLTQRQYFEALRRAKAGAYRIIYVAPERLTTESFRAFAQQIEIPFVAVDEAHCVSQWGQNFRPEYLHIPEFISSLPRRPVVGAFTATATPVVKEDIVRLLELREPFSLTSGFDRENLYFSVMHPDSKDTQLRRLLRDVDGSAVVYCSTRKNVEEVQQMLRQSGFDAVRYHAGLTQEERKQNQEDFLFDRSRIMVATNAFGMGIDKSDIRLVVHYNMPKDMESYYQEAGRAGRDGARAKCVLLYSGMDVRINRFLIDHGNENDELDAQTWKQLRERELKKLDRMVEYCRTTGCLRQNILAYFGETHPGACGTCGNCLDMGDAEDVTAQAKAMLSCVLQTGERYGMRMVIQVLRGSREERIRSMGLDSLPVYGLLREESEERVDALCRTLLARGYLRRSGTDYPILSVTQKGRDFLRGDTAMRARLPLPSQTLRRKKAQEEEKARDMPADPALLEKLRALRLQIARAQSVPAFVVFTDAALLDMCRRKPQTMAQFLQVSGVGDAKARRYGEKFIAYVRAHLSADAE